MTVARRRKPLRDARGRFTSAPSPSPRTQKKTKAANVKALAAAAVSIPKRPAPKPSKPSKPARPTKPAKPAPKRPTKPAPKPSKPSKPAPLPPHQKPKAKKKRKKKITAGEMYQRMSANLAEARDAMRVGPASEFAEYESRCVENSDDSVDGELTASMVTTLPHAGNDVLLSLEAALRMPSSVWVSVAFTIRYPPRAPEKEQARGLGKGKKKKGSPKWRKVRSLEDGGVDEVTKVYWQRANLKAYHYVTARQIIRDIIARSPQATIRRVKVRVYWSSDGERPSRSR